MKVEEENPRNRVEVKCEHKLAYRFHEHAPMYCPNCEKYVEYIIIDHKSVLK